MSNSITQDMAFRQSLMQYAKKYGVSRASRKYNKSRSYIYFWKKRWDGSVASLACASRRPHSHPNQHTEDELKLIRDMRRRNPTLGMLELWHRLRQRGYSRCPESLFRVMRKLGLSPAEKPKKKYKPKPYEQMTHPGERVQVDVKVVPRRCIADPELRLFQYTAIDEFTRLRFLAAYPEQSTYSSADFLRRLRAWYARRGIQVECVQTDNGFEFTNRFSNSKRDLPTLFEKTAAELGIKEIFSEITGKSASALKIQKERQEPKIVLVYSACGGTGKTTVAMGISASLTKNYKRVLYINAARLQVFQHMLENPSAITAADVYTKLSASTDSIYENIKHVIRKELFNYLPPFKAALMSLGLPYSVFERIIISAKKSGEYDFIVVDADITFDEDKASLLNIADKVLIVTKQNLSSVIATNILVANINGANTEKYSFVCNDFDKEKDNSLISPNVSVKFSIDEYIEHFRHYDKMSPDDFSKENSIQKAAFLTI